MQQQLQQQNQQQQQKQGNQWELNINSSDSDDSFDVNKLIQQQQQQQQNQNNQNQNFIQQQILDANILSDNDPGIFGNHEERHFNDFIDGRTTPIRLPINSRNTSRSSNKSQDNL